MDITAEMMIATFAKQQLYQATNAGISVGLSPVTVAASLMQFAASCLATVAPAEAVALIRAYADVIEAGEPDSEAFASARSRFDGAALAFTAVARAAQDFPTPQGRA